MDESQEGFMPVATAQVENKSHLHQETATGRQLELQYQGYPTDSFERDKNAVTVTKPLTEERSNSSSNIIVTYSPYEIVPINDRFIVGGKNKPNSYKFSESIFDIDKSLLLNSCDAAYYAKNSTPQPQRQSNQTSSHDSYDLVMADKNNKSKYHPENLNEKQREIYTYISNNSTSMSLIQAGPGTGKTFTLSCIANHLKKPSVVIIYKHDLLDSFSATATTYTVAKFFMTMFNLKYYNYKQFEMQINGKLSKYEFSLCLINLIRIARVNMPNLRNHIVILDEYPVIMKPALTILLILLEFYEIQTVICGDKNQLQAICDSKHSVCSSYTIAKHFAHKVFSLDSNVRCTNSNYNDLIEYIAQFSSTTKLDHFAYAVVAAIFPNQLLSISNYHDVHLAALHSELAESIHSLVARNAFHYEYYLIDGFSLKSEDVQHHKFIRDSTTGMYYPACVSSLFDRKRNFKVGKFVPYLPLVENALYYVHKHSEKNLAILKSIDLENKTLTLVDYHEPSIKIVVSKKCNNEVLFEEHAIYLLSNSKGRLYNYPIYPANFMSMHKCQGCTITNSLDLILNNTNYQGLYVALSRVQTPNQIKRIQIPDQIIYLTSAIINFPEFVNFNNLSDKNSMEILPIEILKSRMINYKLYIISNNIPFFAELNWKFFNAPSVELRQSIRQQIIIEASKVSRVVIVENSILKMLRQRQCVVPSSVSEASSSSRLNFENSTTLRYQENNSNLSADELSNLTTLNVLIQKRTLLLAISQINNIHDRCVWLHEMALCVPELFSIDRHELKLYKMQSRKFQEEYSKQTENASDISLASKITFNRQSNTLVDITDLNKAYDLNVPTVYYIKHTAKVNSYDGNRRQYIVERLTETIVRETTEFCFNVYKKYEQRKKIKPEWLMAQLKLLLKKSSNEAVVPHNETVSQKQKKQNSNTTSDENLKRKSVKDICSNSNIINRISDKIANIKKAKLS